MIKGAFANDFRTSLKLPHEKLVFGLDYLATIPFINPEFLSLIQHRFRTGSSKKKTSELPFFSSGATYVFIIALNDLLKSTSRKDARTTKKSFVNCW